MNRKTDLQPKIIEQPGFRVVGMKQSFNAETKSGIPSLWDRFDANVQRISGKLGNAAYGVCLTTNRSDGEFDYFAGVEVEGAAPVPEGLAAVDIPQQTYAVFTHRVDPDLSLQEGLQETLRQIWGVWLPESDFELAESPDFERYDDRFEPAVPRGEFDICVPIRSK